jgi:hypothetical protein
VKAAVEAKLRLSIERIENSLQRISGLVAVAEVGLERFRPRQGTPEDILPAAVVLIHAYLEDFLRTIAAPLLSVVDENCLNGIPSRDF